MCSTSQRARQTSHSMRLFRGKSTASAVHDYSLLWIDMTVSVRDPTAFESFQSMFKLHKLSALASIESEIERLKPDGLCFDFDFPTKQGLQLLQETKQKRRSLPILMLTVQHSEALAVWAFRSRVWDYLVKPLPISEVQRCLTCLAEMMAYRERASRRAAIPISTIPEENRISAARGQQPHALDAAITYVEQNFRGKVTSAKAAALCRLTTFQFSRLFRETYGLTFQEYLIRYRMREACRLLKNPNAQVTDVAFLVGFNDPSYFTKVFRRYTNVSPSRYSEVSGSTIDPESLLGGVERRLT